MKAIVFLVLIFMGMNVKAQKDFPCDRIATSNGDLKIHLVGHGTLWLDWNDLVIHIDPVSREADYSAMPDGDLILITHHHGDHFDMKAIEEINQLGTAVILTPKCREMMEKNGYNLMVMKNGDSLQTHGITIEAIPAYNMLHKRENGEFYHPRGEGNGYILNLGEKRILIAGDTENIPEIKQLKNIDIAFLPMNLPYTMTPEMVSDAAKAFRPHILYPYHYGNTNPQKLVELMKDVQEVEVRVRDL